VVIPQPWLVPNLTLDAVRALQRSDTTSDMDQGNLRLTGAEVLVARNWVQDEFWPRIQDAIQRGRRPTPSCGSGVIGAGGGARKGSRDTSFGSG